MVLVNPICTYADFLRTTWDYQEFVKWFLLNLEKFLFIYLADGSFCPNITVPGGSFEITKYRFPGFPQELAVTCNGYPNTYYKVVCTGGIWKEMPTCTGTFLIKNNKEWIETLLPNVNALQLFFGFRKWKKKWKKIQTKLFVLTNFTKKATFSFNHGKNISRTSPVFSILRPKWVIFARILYLATFKQ